MDARQKESRLLIGSAASESAIAVDPGAAPPAVENPPPAVMNLTEYLSRAAPLLRELEESWERGTAGPVLEQCSSVLRGLTLRTYRKLLRRKAAPPAFRRPLLERLLKQLAQSLRPPLHLFPARADPRLYSHQPMPGIKGPALSGLFVEDLEIPWILLSQAFAARSWGVWYELDHPGLQARLDAAWSRSVIHAFEANLAEMNRIHGLGIQLNAAALQHEESMGVLFEQLVLDILNENGPQAKRAPLHEDLCERTDLRVNYPSLQRKRGARIQVTFLTDEVLHETKLRRMIRGNEFVVVSPIILAGAALNLTRAPWVGRLRKDQFFAALSWPKPALDELAMALKSHFLRALGNPKTPLGPLLSVAVPIRRFIREYVKSEAQAVTRQLRRRESAGELSGYRVDRHEK